MYHRRQILQFDALVAYILILLTFAKLVASYDSSIKPLSSTAYKFPKFLYDDSYITNQLDSRFPYLKLGENSTDYIGPRDYFNFSQVFEPDKDYFDRVGIEEHMFEELRSLEISGTITTLDQWYYSSLEGELNSSKPPANEEKCKYQLDFLEAELNKTVENNYTNLFQPGYKNVQLLRLMDSWGRPPSETYYGHSYWVGSYRGCQHHQLSFEFDNSTSTKFRYCWAKLTAESWPKNDEIIPPTNIRSGICLPESCDGRLAMKYKSQILKLMHFNFSPLHRSRFNRIIHVYCLPTKTGLTSEAKLFLAFVASWLSLILCISIFASLYESDQRRIPILLKCLTLQYNFSKFNSDDTPTQVANNNQNYVDLRPMGLMKFFASLGVCIAHTGCAFGWSFTASTFIIESYRDIIYYFMVSLYKNVDLFLILGGLTTSYTIIGKFQGPKQKLHSILKPHIYLMLNVARYLRLAPLFILSIAFMKSTYIHLADSPHWDYGTYEFSIQGQCQRSSWWRVLALPILVGFKGNSYYNECLAISWYLIADMRLALIAPFLIYFISRPEATNKQRFLVILATFIVSVVSQCIGFLAQRLVFFQQLISYGYLIGANLLTLTFGETSYFSAINRLFTFTIGLLVGHYLRDYQRGGRKRWPNWMYGVYFGALLAWQFYDFFTPVITHYNYITYKQLPSENTIMLTLLLKPRIEAIMFAIIILRMMTDLAPKLMENSVPLYKLSKLSYCVFIIHSIVISYSVTSDERSRMDSFFSEYLRTNVFVICMSFLISFPVYLLIESPLAQLINMLFKQRKKSSISQASSSKTS